MKKSIIFSALATAGMFAAPAANAALTGGEFLEINAGTYVCNAGAGTYPSCTYGTNVPTGSYFAMNTGGSAGFDNGEKVAIGGVDGGLGGLALDYAGGQTNGQIDDPWAFGGSNLGRHNTTGQGVSPTVVAGGDVNMQGWTVYWGASGAEVNINMGTGANATVDCGTGTCAVGESYVLDYQTVVPAGQPFEGVPYALHLEGTVRADVYVSGTSQVPVPAAVWLFGTGLLGLVGVARRKAA